MQGGGGARRACVSSTGLGLTSRRARPTTASELASAGSWAGSSSSLGRAVSGDRGLSRPDLLVADWAGVLLTVATRGGVEAVGTLIGVDSFTPRDHVIFGRAGVGLGLGVEASTRVIDAAGRARGVEYACDACGRDAPGPLRGGVRAALAVATGCGPAGRGDSASESLSLAGASPTSTQLPVIAAHTLSRRRASSASDISRSDAVASTSAAAIFAAGSCVCGGDARVAREVFFSQAERARARGPRRARGRVGRA